MKFTTADGTEVDIPDEQVMGSKAFTDLKTSLEAQIADLKAKAPGAGQQVVDATALNTLTASVTALTGKVTELSTTIEDTKKAQAKKDAEAKVAKLVKEGKIKADAETQATFVELATNAPEQFDKMAEKLQPIVALRQPFGSDSSGLEGEEAATQMHQLVRKHIEDEAKAGRKVSPSDAIKAVSLANPDLAREYRSQMNQPGRVDAGRADRVN